MEANTPAKRSEKTELTASELEDVSGGCFCEFPVQKVELRRKVEITNSSPSIVQTKTDACGNPIP